VVYLETPYAAIKPEAVDHGQIILAGLRAPSDYWVRLAVDWLEQGAPVNIEICKELERVASTHHLDQGLRHKAFAMARSFIRSQTIEELDIVRVIGRLNAERDYYGTPGVMRTPRAGDLGTVVAVHGRTSSEALYTVEAVSPDGLTLWVADFLLHELRLESKNKPISGKG
jgi:hypothetical protein